MFVQSWIVARNGCTGIVLAYSFCCTRGFEFVQVGVLERFG